jgi:hypothetical protein
MKVKPIEQKAIATLIADEVSLGKNKKVYAKKGERVEVTVKNGEVLIARSLKTNEKFSVNKSNLIF